MKYRVWKTDDANDSFEINVGEGVNPSLVALSFVGYSISDKPVQHKTEISKAHRREAYYVGTKARVMIWEWDCDEGNRFFWEDEPTRTIDPNDRKLPEYDVIGAIVSMQKEGDTQGATLTDEEF